VVTGTEVLTGRVADRNGPWLAEQLRVHGVDVGQVIVVGDRPDDLFGALRFLRGSNVDLIVTSGGLGPTADDLTAEIVGSFQGRPSELDTELERTIADIIERFSAGRGWRVDDAATTAAIRKQAMVPVGATALAPVGTAPGLVVPARDDGPPVVVLPGPPRELRPMWPVAVEHPAIRDALRDRSELRQRTIRLWGTAESELAATMREHPDALRDLEITTCLRDGELEVVTRFGSGAQSGYDEFESLVAATYASTLLSTDGRTIDAVVADTLLARGLTIGTAESCTAGLLAGRLADRPGSSAYLLGGLVTYSNEAKHELLGVPTGLIERVGAVSAEVAEAMADGARTKIGCDVGVGITGVAGPGGGTPDKPVGLVHFCVVGPRGSAARGVRLPGGRADVRRRAVVLALHLVREALG